MTDVTGEEVLGTAAEEEPAFLPLLWDSRFVSPSSRDSLFRNFFLSVRFISTVTKRSKHAFVAPYNVYHGDGLVLLIS